MRIGYARISTADQHMDAQLELLKQANCDQIFKDVMTGSTSKRPALNEVLSMVKSGDSLVVTKLDRLARSTKDALNIIDDLTTKDVSLVVLNLGGSAVDTSTATGRMMITMLAAVAEFERAINHERQREGIVSAKKRGVYKGRPKTYNAHHKGLQHAVNLYFDRDSNRMTVKDISNITQISVPTIYREIHRRKLNEIE